MVYIFPEKPIYCTTKPKTHVFIVVVLKNVVECNCDKTSKMMECSNFMEILVFAWTEVPLPARNCRAMDSVSSNEFVRVIKVSEFRKI